MADFVYLLALLLASPYLLWRAICRKEFRDGRSQYLFGRVPRLGPVALGKERIWFHAASVGEVDLLKPVVAELEKTCPDVEFVVSATTRTGRDAARKAFDGRAVSVFFCPFDFSWATRAAIRRVAPTKLVLVELELWPNLLRAAKRSGASVAIINGRISDRSFPKYRLLRPLLAATFRRVDLIAAQDALSADRFRYLTPNSERVVVTGSIKFDGVRTDRDNPETRALAKLAGLRAIDVVYLCGSSHAPEESGALETFRRLRDEFPELKLIVVPRHQDRFEEVARLFDSSGIPWTRRSTIAAPLDPAAASSRAILVDAMGELGAWWGTAHIAFVGGSWGSRGGQNMLEPAAYGAAVSFGPNTRNFRAIVDLLLRANAARVVANVDEAASFVRRCLVEPEYRRELGVAARALALGNGGATKRTLEELARI